MCTRILPSISCITRLNIPVIFLIITVLALRGSSQVLDRGSSADISTDTIQNGCFRIDESWNFCKPWAGVFVDVSPVEQDVQSTTFGMHILWTNAPPGQIGKVFDSRLRQFLNPNSSSFDAGLPTGPSSSMKSTFINNLKCPGYSSNISQYFISVLCMQMIDSASPACKGLWKPGVLGLCKSTCDTNANTLSSIFNNQTICPGTEPARDSMLQLYKTLCTQNGFRETDTSRCISGRTVEGNTCGFLEKDYVCDPNFCPEGAKSNSICPNSTKGPSPGHEPILSPNQPGSNSMEVSPGALLLISIYVMLVLIGVVALVLLVKLRKKKETQVPYVWQPPKRPATVWQPPKRPATSFHNTDFQFEVPPLPPLGIHSVHSNQGTAQLITNKPAAVATPPTTSI